MSSFQDTVHSRLFKLQIKDTLFVFLGCAIYAIGFSAFILPEQIVSGGVAGIAALLYYAFKIPVGPAVLVINGLLLLIAFKALSRQFVIRTIMGVIALSFFLSVAQSLFEAFPLVTAGQDRFMHLLIGGIIAGIGLGIAISHNGSTGGTDIVVALLAKHTRMSFGRAMQLVDLIIISSSWLLFHSAETIVYGIVYLLVASIVTDYVINGTRQTVQFLIISKRYSEIADAVNQRAGRGVTILKGEGWYSKKDVEVVMVLCRKYESRYIFTIIKSIDPNAMVSQTNCTGVFGEGFDTIK